MTVYVDDQKNPFGRMLMSHMVADSVEELHAMAKHIGLRRRWFQISRSGFPHYDVCQSKREQAIRSGAKAITVRELVHIIDTERNRV